MSRSGSHLAVVALLGALTVAMTWPLALELGHSVRDPGDPLLNSWILAWDVHQLLTGNFGGLFDANIFYPHDRTLAYSEHLLPQSLAAAAPLLATGNPVLAYNLVMLLSFFGSALGMYCYARHLTGGVVAGVVAGICYGFSPFMFDHLSHVQTQAAGGIPLVFLFLSRFFAEERWRDLLLAVGFLVLQILANGYYAVYISFFFGVVVVYHLLASGKLRDGRFLAKLAAGGMLSGALAGPFLLQYAIVQREMGLVREPGYPAHLSSFLTAPPFNRLYGGWFEGFPEATLFPGLVPVALAAMMIARDLPSWLKRRTAASRLAGITVKASTLYLVALVGLCLLTGSVAVFGRVELGTASAAGPLLLIALGVGIRAALDPPFRDRWFPPLTTPTRWLRLHVVMLAFTVVCSFGTSIPGPYQLLYRYVPGFDGLRAVPRIHIMSLLSLAALAAFGVQALATSRRRWVRVGAIAVVPLAVVAELWSVPLPLVQVPVKGQLPEVTRWLAEEGSGAPILELPFTTEGDGGDGTEIFNVYCSTVHWRPMVNGYSGFMPPAYLELRRRWDDQAPARALEDARLLGVRQVVLHTDRFVPEPLASTRAALTAMTPPARRIASLTDGEVWELPPPTGSPAPGAAPGPPLDRRGWTVTSNDNRERAADAIDGDLETRWESSPQRPGVTFTLDLGAEVEVQGVELLLGSSIWDFPRGYRVEVSSGAEPWREVASGGLPVLPITAFLRPLRLAVTIPFAPVRVRMVRLTSTVAFEDKFWSIHELELW